MGIKTPLYEEHVKLKAKLVDFHGFILPVLYKSIKEEHNYVRTKSGIFDISHMGQILVEGADALNFIQYISTNNAETFKDGQAFYTLLCKDNGGIIDDLIVLKYSNTKFFLVVNASNIKKDYRWITEHSAKYPSIEVTNLSDKLGMLAFQGPLSTIVLSTVLADKNLPEHFYFSETVFNNETLIISRTGYTGEDGFELILSGETSVALWRKIVETAGNNTLPCGLGARDTLRTEASYMLYGNDIDEDHTPIQAGIGWAVKKKGNIGYIGKDVLMDQKYNGVQIKLIGFKTLKPGIPRQGNIIISKEGKRIGYVTSATYGPYLKKTIGMAYVDINYSKIGTCFTVKNNNREIEAEVVKLPFYKR